MITPQTKVLELIEAYPQLEEVIVGIVPAFEKLRNPFLRKTVARISTLQQVASIGNLKVEDLINKLRREVGQDLFPEQAGVSYHTEKPGWFDEKLISQEVDVRPMLAEGEHPVHRVMADLSSMKKGGIYKMIAPFLPAPLIDKAASLGAEHWVVKEREDLFVIYFHFPE